MPEPSMPDYQPINRQNSDLSTSRALIPRNSTEFPKPEFATPQDDGSERSRPSNVRADLPTVLLTIIYSLIFVGLGAAIAVLLKRPYLGLLVSSLGTGIVAWMAASRIMRKALRRDRKHYEQQLLNNQQLSNQLFLAERQTEKAAFQRQLMSQVISRSQQQPNLSLLFDGVVEGVRERLRSDRVCIYQFNPDWTGTIVAESVADGLPQALHETIGDPCFQDHYVEPYQNGLITKINDVYNEPRVTDCYLQLLEQYRVRANLVTPIRQNQRLFGLLIAHQCSAPRNWTEADTALMTQSCLEIEFHLDFIQRSQDQAISAEYAWFLGDIAGRARQNQRFQDVLQATLKGVRHLLATDRVMFYQFQSDWSGTMSAESVDPKWSSVLHEQIDDPCFRGQYVDLYRNGRVRAISNLRQTPGLSECHIRTLERYDVKANLVAPIRHKNTLLGLLIAHHCAAPRYWRDSEIDFFTQAASQLEYTLEHISFIERLELNAERARLFGDIAFRVRQSQDEPDVLHSTALGALNTLKTNRAMVYRFNADGSGTMVAEARDSDRWIKILDNKIEDPCFRERYIDLYRNGRVRAINDIFQEPSLTDCHIHTLEKYGVKANLVVPIRRDGQLFGLLIAHQCDAPRIWQQQEIDFLSELARQLEYALDHLSFIQNLEDAYHQAEQGSQAQYQQTAIVKHQLELLRHDMQDAMDGDLTVRAALPDGDMGILATFLNDAIANLQRIVLQVQSASEAVTQAVGVNQEHVATLPQVTLQQATVIAHILEDAQEMADSSHIVAANAQHANLKVQMANRVLLEGDEAMNESVKAISALQAKVEEITQSMKVLGETSQTIASAVTLIRDLANQTHALALNASMEASQPSDSSQGFSMIAEEVLLIAERSTATTHQIEQMVGAIQANTKQVLTAMDDWRTQVVTGSERVEMTRQKLNSIALVSGEIRTLVEAIAHAANEQSEVSTVVSSAIAEVEAIAVQNASQSASVAESFEQLLAVAEELQDSVSRFKAQ
jgi:methyl-accepting chemotaxis protein PixJ